ncbi:MAG: response regulator [Altibacter sp.]|uniref:ATP-binding protein n=1 Tax=Altibacter sp. TaxID=2024823 RepID=UPI001D669889|nr:ATP-binding protein [Altibacter sp.]MBZ0326488.1 response regulator [Altibacter sp.]
MKYFIKWLLPFFLVLLSHNCIGQDITFTNYVNKFKEAQNHINLGEYKKAATLHYALLNFLEQKKEFVKDTIDIWYTKNYYSLSRMYLFEEDLLSLKYADSTISSALRTGDNKLIFRGYSLKYYCLYDVKGKEKTLDSLADQCIHYSLLTKDQEDLAESYMHKCNALVELNLPEKAFNYCKLAENIFNETTDEQYLSSVFNNIANVFVKGGQIDKALAYYKKSHLLAIKLKDQAQFLVSSRNLAEKNELVKNFEEASIYYRQYGDSTKAYLEKKLLSGFTEAEAKYKTEQKDRAIAEQQLIIAKQNNTRNLYIFSAIALLLLALGIFMWLTNKQKRKKLLVETELQKEQEINDLRSKFLGNIAHEIRTPLTLISGNLNLALENFDHTEKAKMNISIALENSKKVTSDANEILELLKFEKNKITLNKTIVLLDETLKRIALSFGSLAQMKEISLVYHSEIPKNYYTSIDLEKNEKIINNLISNAIKYSPSKKEIKVHCELENEILILQVTDQGEGIHYDETEKIFERFYQSQNAEAVGGVGIGLSLSRELAQIMDGTLTVTSDYGKGSTFIFTLPAPQIASEAIPQKVLPPKGITPSEAPKKVAKSVIKSNILIVEDNPQMASYLKEILSEKHHCTLAFDGEEAIQKIKQESFDLITSDIMMPKVDGFELRKKLNEDAKYKNIPFILISAKTLEEDKIRGFKLGIDDYIIKPFNKNELSARIENLLNNKRAREAWELQNKDLVNDNESSDQKLLKTIEAIVIENLSNEDFKIDSLAAGVNYSQRQLTRILKQYTGMTPVQFILEIRLQKAYQLLQQRTFFTLSEVRYDVGILSSPYFNKKFKERFGIAPSELLS